MKHLARHDIIMIGRNAWELFEEIQDKFGTEYAKEFVLNFYKGASGE